MDTVSVDDKSPMDPGSMYYLVLHAAEGSFYRLELSLCEKRQNKSM